MAISGHVLLVSHVLPDVLKCGIQFNLVVDSFPFLDHHYIFYCLNYGEFIDVLSEFTRSDLSIIEKVLNDVGQNIS